MKKKCVLKRRMFVAVSVLLSCLMFFSSFKVTFGYVIFSLTVTEDTSPQEYWFDCFWDFSLKVDVEISDLTTNYVYDNFTEAIINGGNNSVYLAIFSDSISLIVTDNGVVLVDIGISGFGGISEGSNVTLLFIHDGDATVYVDDVEVYSVDVSGGDGFPNGFEHAVVSMTGTGYATYILDNLVTPISVSLPCTIELTWEELNSATKFYDVTGGTNPWQAEMTNTCVDDAVYVFFANFDLTVDYSPYEEGQYCIRFKIYDDSTYQLKVAWYGESYYLVDEPKSFTTLSFTYIGTILTLNDGETTEYDLSEYGFTAFDLTNLFFRSDYGELSSGTFTATLSSYTPETLDTLNVGLLWTNIQNGDLYGFFQACFLTAWTNPDLLYGVIAMLFLVPLYIRTRSLTLICILWILLGSLLIALMPIVSGIAILFLALGIGGLFFRLFRT